jgi:hypothetical protein
MGAQAEAFGVDDAAIDAIDISTAIHEAMLYTAFPSGSMVSLPTYTYPNRLPKGHQHKPETNHTTANKTTPHAR